MITNPLGVIALSKREIYRFLSVITQTVFPPLISSTLFMFIFGVALGDRIDLSATGMSYLQFIVPGLMTMHLISSSYENTSSSLFIARWHNHIQEVLLSPLSYLEMVLGLLAGGLVRGLLVFTGVYLVSLFFEIIPIVYPLHLLLIVVLISIIFSCAGMLGALWAEDFAMLNMWNIYVIIPLVFLGGVFHPISMLPEVLQAISKFNPILYLVQGVRFSITGLSEVPYISSLTIAFVMASILFSATVYLFKLGYKLRT